METQHKERLRLRVFVASPSDVASERDRAEQVIHELNRGIADSFGLSLDCIRFETHVTPLMGRPEAVILDQIDLGTLDIFVGILWLRFGTPTGDADPSGTSPYLSGTEQEFSLAYQNWKTKGKPNILFYHCTRSPEDIAAIQPAQLQRVRDFVNGFGHDKKHPGLVRQYKTVEEFERRLREDLLYLLRKSAPKELTLRGSELGEYHTQQGFLRLYLPSANAERDSFKAASLSNTSQIRLLAQSGYSFLGLVGHMFRETLTRRLESGASMHLILLAPWTKAGLMIALGEREARSTTNGFALQAPSLTELDPVGVIQNSAWYSTKIRDSMNGYRQLRARFRQQIEVRLTDHEIPASILITDEDCFFEPYLNVNLQERHLRDMLTFEVQTNSRSHLYGHAADFFESMWVLSEPYENYQSREELKKREFALRIKEEPSTGNNSTNVDSQGEQGMG